MFTTLDNVKNYLLIDIDADFEPVAESYIEAVTAYIERYTGRKFSADSTPAPRFYDGTDNAELFIDDAVEITQVKIDNAVISDSDYKLYPANKSPKTRIILPYRTFAWGAQNVEVTAKWGYGASVPADLEFAATVMVASIVNAQKEKAADDKVKSETVGRYSVTYETGSAMEHDFTEAKKILKFYRRMI